MAGEPPAALLQVAGSSDWQCAKQELMNRPLLPEPEKPLTDATIWSLKSEFLSWELSETVPFSEHRLLDIERCDHGYAWVVHLVNLAGTSSGTRRRQSGWTCRLARRRQGQLRWAPGSPVSDRSSTTAALIIRRMIQQCCQKG